MTGKQRIVVFASGQLDDDDGIKQRIRPESDLIYCADGGANHAARLGFVPDLVIGDLDSISDEIKAALRANGRTELVEDPDQRRTDLELVLARAIDRAPDEIWVYGAFGGRLDHLLANITLLATLKAPMPVYLAEVNQYLFHSRKTVTLSGKPGDIVGVTPLEPIPSLRYEGLLWPANEPPYALGWQGASNRMTGNSATIYIEEGQALITHMSV